MNRPVSQTPAAVAARKATIRRMALDGATRRDMATAVGVDPRTVDRYLRDLGITYQPTRSAHAARIAAVASLHAKGIQANRIADRLGIGLWTVYRDLKRSGVDYMPDRRGRKRDWGRPTVHRPECGSRSGYRLHAKHDDEPCEPCRRANTSARMAALAAADRTGQP